MTGRKTDMIVVMNSNSSDEHVGRVVDLLSERGVDSLAVSRGSQRMVEVFGETSAQDRSVLENIPMVNRILDGEGPILAAGREPGDSTFEIPLGNGATIGGRKIGLIAGPCSVESADQILQIAQAVKDAGAVALRGGAFKPRTSPYSFQGHGERGLEMLARVREETGLAIVTEVMRCEHVELVAKYADVLQIGSRNMHHTHLLAEVGKQSKPILLKRGWGATLKEFLLAAEYVMLQGNRNVILCERGIRSYETYVRNTLALAVVPEIKRTSRLPIIVDPSHGTGRAHLVAPMSRAAVACGADGLIIEVHNSPSEAWTDAAQALDASQFKTLARELRPFADACCRGL
jgi:3-deoxy-7-phosphoheptulonate synthase